jgi:hypothetical protein
VSRVWRCVVTMAWCSALGGKCWLNVRGARSSKALCVDSGPHLSEQLVSVYVQRSVSLTLRLPLNINRACARSMTSAEGAAAAFLAAVVRGRFVRFGIFYSLSLALAPSLAASTALLIPALSLAYSADYRHHCKVRIASSGPKRHSVLIARYMK